MSNKVTLNQIKQLVAQLTPQEQIKLIALICQRLSELTLPETTEERWKLDYATRVEAYLKLSEEMAATTVNDVDSVQDIRQAREERTSRL
ncbi:MAG: hypothetical protein ACE5R6_15735 [Candidatus Heimdallarchaeota archaeon]